MKRKKRNSFQQLQRTKPLETPLLAIGLPCWRAFGARNRSSGNTWLDLTRLGVEQNCLTFVRWRNCPDSQKPGCPDVRMSGCPERDFGGAQAAFGDVGSGAYGKRDATNV